jgi:hypothetical protein
MLFLKSACLYSFLIPSLNFSNRLFENCSLYTTAISGGVMLFPFSHNARIYEWIGAGLAVQQWRSHAQTKLRNDIPTTCACYALSSSVKHWLETKLLLKFVYDETLIKKSHKFGSRLV